MSSPQGFSWIEKPHLAGLAHPTAAEDLIWLRQQGIQLLISLTEARPRRDWINDAGLLHLHVPVVDMEPPTQDQIDLCMSSIERAKENQMGVAVHCGAGLGRTGVILAAYLVGQGMTAQQAISRVRRIRPGSIETDEQAEAVVEYARRRGQQLND